MGAVGFVGFDGGEAGEAAGDLVQALHQGVLPGGLELEAEAQPLGSHGLFWQVHGDGAGGLRQLLDGRHGQGQGEDAVGEAVVEEDLGEAGGDDAADAEVQQGPGGVLPARAAAEVGAAQEELRTPEGRLVQDEVRQLTAFGVVAELGKEVLFDCYCWNGCSGTSSSNSTS